MYYVRPYLGGALAAALLLVLLALATRAGQSPATLPTPEYETGAGVLESSPKPGTTVETVSPGNPVPGCPDIPIPWQLGDLAPRFQLSPREALELVEAAAGMWERAVGAPLFTPYQEYREPRPFADPDSSMVPTPRPGDNSRVLTVRFFHTEGEASPVPLGTTGDPARGMEAGAYRTLTVRGPQEEELVRREIRVFRSGDAGEILRILAHEMGHALGLPHVEEPGFIMSPAYGAWEGVPRVHPQSLERLEGCLSAPTRATRTPRTAPEIP